MNDNRKIFFEKFQTISSRQVMRIGKKSIRGLLVDPIPNSPYYVIRILWQSERKIIFLPFITIEILGVKELTI